MEDKKTVPLFTQNIKSADITRSSIRCMGCMEEFSAEFEICPHCGYAVGSKPKSPYCLRPGMNLSGRYMLGKVIGQGGFGITYIGWDTVENRKVAVKEFFPNALSTRTEGETVVSCYNEKAENYFKEGVKKMMDEGERLSKFSNHPNIVDVCDNFEENNTAYIVMEYLDGKSLKEYAEENGGKIAPDEAVKLMMPVLDALNAMHKENMIHRDIAPDNVYICNDGTIKLLDFGSARIAVEDAEKSLSVMVKPGYAPKEQYASRSKQGPWTDVYSVCATLYRLITGEAPVESIERDTTPLKTFASFGITGYDTLENIITKGLEPDCEKRLRNADALRNIITRTVLTDKSKHVAAPVTPESVKKEPQLQKEFEAKKKKKPIGIIIAAVVACLVFVVSVSTGVFVFNILQEPLPKGLVRKTGQLTESIEWTLYWNGCLHIEGNGDMPDYAYDVNGTQDPLGKNIFGKSLRDKIKSVVIGEGITNIGYGMFSNCTNMETVYISDTVENIGSDAFMFCGNVEKITIPESMTIIGVRAFMGCGAKEIVLHKKVTKIGAYAISNCHNLNNITIPDGVTVIDDWAFHYSENLKTITVPESVTSIGEYAFHYCSGLTDVYYTGTEQQWNEISISDVANDALLNATIHFNSNTDNPEIYEEFEEAYSKILTNIFEESEIATEVPVIQTPTEVRTTQAPATDMSKAEFVEFLNAETVKASRGTYNYNRSCNYTSPIDAGNATETLNSVISAIDENSDLYSFVGNYLGIGTKKGTYPKDKLESNYTLKATNLRETDLQNFTANNGTYTFTLANTTNPKKTGMTSISRFTNDFITVEEVRGKISEFTTAITVEDAEIVCNNTKVEVKVIEGKIVSIKYAYDFNAEFHLKAIVNIMLTFAAKTTGQYTDIKY